MAVDRHINFFEYQKACAEPGCPLCRIIAVRAERYIDNMLFEHVSDRGFRRAHRLAGGFCDTHSRNLVSFRDGLAVAILGRDILEERIRHFNKRIPWRPQEKCPVCVERERIEVEYLSFLAQCNGESAEEQELRQSYLASDGLCAVHYGQLLEMIRAGNTREKTSFLKRLVKSFSFKKEPPAWIKQFEEAKFAALKTRVDAFIELSAYGRQEEFRQLSPKDQVVWKELALSLRGGVT